MPHIASRLSLEQLLRRRWWRGRDEEEEGEDVDGEEDEEDGDEYLGEDGEGEVGG